MPSGPCLKDVLNNTDADDNQTGTYRPCRLDCPFRSSAETIGESLGMPGATEKAKKQARRIGKKVAQSLKASQRCPLPDLPK